MTTKSEYLFIFGCIPARILLTLFARKHPDPLNSAVAAIIALGFAHLWLNPGLRSKGIETFGAPIWWSRERGIHALLWTLFAISNLQGKQYAWKFLAIDVVVGLINFLFLKPRN